MSALAFIAMIAATATPEPGLAAAPATPDERYRACIADVRSNAEDVRRRAELWLNEGGGPPALHCQALADLALGKPRLAGVRLHALADRPDAGDALERARIYAQAALAFVDAGLSDEAARAIDEAYTLAPEGGELHLSAALVSLAEGKHQAAIDQVSAAEAVGIVSAAGFVARARAKIALTQYREAADDVVAALALDPVNIAALTVRGELHQFGVDIDASIGGAN